MVFLYQFNLRLHHFSFFFNVKNIFFFKSLQVCDWLAKCLIMLGFMDLRRPRVVRHSNVGLVLFVDDHRSDSFANLEKYFMAKLKWRLLTLNFAVAIGWWIYGFCNFVRVLFLLLISWSFKMHFGLRNICFGNKYLEASPHTVSGLQCAWRSSCLCLVLILCLDRSYPIWVQRHSAAQRCILIQFQRKG